MKVIAACLVRNEADRYWQRVLDHLSEQVDGIVVLDNDSTDGTQAITAACPKVIRHEVVPGPMWGNESVYRKRLWDLAASYHCWVLFNDADQMLQGDIRPLCDTTEANAWAFPLYDLWDSETTFRSDGYWQAHDHPRVWLVHPDRTPREWTAEWGQRGLHTGHLPPNFPLRALVAPPDYHWLHYAYVRPDHRQQKLLRYQSVSDQLTDFERAHAASIADATPLLRTLPAHKPIKILVGASVRKPLEVLKAHLATLEWQMVPDRVQLGFAFVPDFEDPNDPALQYLVDWTAGQQGILLQGVPPTSGDFADGANQMTHQWQATSMGRVGENKNRILKYAVQNGFDYVFLVDSDLLLDRTVLTSLLTLDAPIASAVYWTRWDRIAQQRKLHAGPQVWLRHVYEPFQSGGIARGYTEQEFRAELVSRRVTRVWGLGACTLIARSVIEKGVGFHRYPWLPTGGLWDGEDRHFCSWAEHLHVPMLADPWPDIFHVYHLPEDVERIPAMMQRLSQDHLSPGLGDLVSLRLRPLEEPAAPVQHVRCRVGDGMLIPDIEATLPQMTLGQTRIVKVQFPSDYALAPYRGKQRLIEVTLVDAKPMGFPPVLEEEMLVTAQGTYRDMVTLTPEQHQALEAA